MFMENCPFSLICVMKFAEDIFKYRIVYPISEKTPAVIMFYQIPIKEPYIYTMY